LSRAATRDWREGNTGTIRLDWTKEDEVTNGNSVAKQGRMEKARSFRRNKSGDALGRDVFEGIGWNEWIRIGKDW
jgi:hypothetical protein